jgi:hypothetical protein
MTSIVLIVHCHTISHVLILKFGLIFILNLQPQNCVFILKLHSQQDLITGRKHELTGWGQRLNSLHRIYLLHCNWSFASI